MRFSALLAVKMIGISCFFFNNQNKRIKWSAASSIEFNEDLLKSLILCFMHRVHVIIGENHSIGIRGRMTITITITKKKNI